MTDQEKPDSRATTPIDFDPTGPLQAPSVTKAGLDQIHDLIRPSADEEAQIDRLRLTKGKGQLPSAPRKKRGSAKATSATMSEAQSAIVSTQMSTLEGNVSSLVASMAEMKSMVEQIDARIVELAAEQKVDRAMIAQSLTDNKGGFATVKKDIATLNNTYGSGLSELVMATKVGLREGDPAPPSTEVPAKTVAEAAKSAAPATTKARLTGQGTPTMKPSVPRSAQAPKQAGKSAPAPLPARLPPSTRKSVPVEPTVEAEQEGDA